MRKIISTLFTLLLINGLSACESTKIPHDASLDCIYVSIDDLYKHYEQYKNRKVCTSGKILQSIEQYYLYPIDRRLMLQRQKVLQIYFSKKSNQFSKLHNRKKVSLIGLFTYPEDCFQNQNHNDDMEVVCAPYQFPLYLNDADLIK